VLPCGSGFCHVRGRLGGIAAVAKSPATAFAPPITIVTLGGENVCPASDGVTTYLPSSNPLNKYVPALEVVVVAVAAPDNASVTMDVVPVTFPEML
jgi:hypothetical protein